MKSGWWIGKFLVFGIAMLALIGWITQLLWNWLVPDLFSGPVLGYWQALGLLALTKILFWSIGKGGGHWRHRHGGPWGQYWSQKWQGMSEEDRERFKQKMKDKWCSPNKNSSTPDSGVSNG